LAALKGNRSPIGLELKEMVVENIFFPFCFTPVSFLPSEAPNLLYALQESETRQSCKVV